METNQTFDLNQRDKRDGFELTDVDHNSCLSSKGHKLLEND